MLFVPRLVQGYMFVLINCVTSTVVVFMFFICDRVY